MYCGDIYRMSRNPQKILTVRNRRLRDDERKKMLSDFFMVSVDLKTKRWIDKEGGGGDVDIYENCPHVYFTFFIVLSSHYIIVCVHINCTHPVKSPIQQYAAIHYLLHFTPIMPYIKFNSLFFCILSILSSSSSRVEKMSPVCR